MNKLIVESKNDKAFIEALIRHINVVAEVDKPIFIDDFEELNGLNSTKLTVKLNDVFSEVAKKPSKKSAFYSILTMRALTTESN